MKYWILHLQCCSPSYALLDCLSFQGSLSGSITSSTLCFACLKEQHYMNNAKVCFQHEEQLDKGCSDLWVAALLKMRKQILRKHFPIEPFSSRILLRYCWFDFVLIFKDRYFILNWFFQMLEWDGWHVPDFLL